MAPARGMTASGGRGSRIWVCLKRGHGEKSKETGEMVKKNTCYSRCQNMSVRHECVLVLRSP